MVNAVRTAGSNARTCPLSRTTAPAPSTARSWRASTTPPAVAMSSAGCPRRWVTVTVVPPSPGGTEYWFPANATSACAVTTRSTVSVAGNRGGSGARPSRAARAATVVVCPFRFRGRTSPTRTQNPSSDACAAAMVMSSGRVRHHRCAAEWFAFSTVPLRFPCRGGHRSTPTP